ncbi:MAG TPA: winged helix-turn-helix domain-containing protein [Terriglobales bacterium]|nr:winged helix-turn-helix domain-containing protein [Terriglobales bacterium]
MDNARHKYAFGVYEANPASGELRKNGMKVKIQEQPFQILLMLLEHPGEVITREQLRARLWPADTFVDFDHGLNTAINKLREAVGDSASNPRFVETLARRGYRFIAPVKVLAPPNDTVRNDVVAANGITPAKPAEAVAPSEPAAVLGLPSVPDGTQHRPNISDSAPEPLARPAAEPAPATVQAESAAEPPAAATRPTSQPEEELPRPSRYVSRLLFGLVQVMYLVFYGVALVQLERIPEIAFGFLGRLTIVLVPLVLVTAAVGIAMRLYLITAVTFDYKALGEKFRKLFPVVLPLDQLWALSPFLLVEQIGIGAAFAACAALLYVPFSERTLIRMGYRW